ncbi:MAG: hypothetical protein PHD67_09255 [Oscillospiraceae bacterium]|nr:hypothetical protein [Oscillospiraceae bacterium]
MNRKPNTAAKKSTRHIAEDQNAPEYSAADVEKIISAVMREVVKEAEGYITNSEILVSFLASFADILHSSEGEYLIDETARRDELPPTNWDSFTDTEITRAVELMIAPGDLAIRGAAIAIFRAFSYTPEDIREQLNAGEYFNAGAVFAGLDSERPAIMYPAGE